MPRKSKKQQKQIAVEVKFRKFADTWLSNGFNGINAAIAAGYKGKREGLYVTASWLLRHPKIRDYINEQLAGAGMGRDEVLARLRMRAEGAPLLDFYSEKKLTTSYTKGGVTTETERYVWLPDIEKVKAAGLDHLVKGISLDGVIEWHDPMSALALLAKHHKLLEPDDDGGQRQPVVIIIDEHREWETAERDRERIRQLKPPQIIDLK